MTATNRQKFTRGYKLGRVLAYTTVVIIVMLPVILITLLLVSKAGV